MKFLVSESEFYSLSPKDQNTLISLWYCPKDRSTLEKKSGPNAGFLDISRGKSNVALQNAVNLRKLPESRLPDAKAIVHITFQLVKSEDNIQSFTLVECPHCGYEGYAPSLPVQLERQTQKNERLIRSLLADSAKMYSAQNSSMQSGRRRFPFFGIFILFWILPIIAGIAFFGWLALYTIFTLL